MNTFLWGSLRGTDIATRICNVTEIICCDKVFPITGQWGFTYTCATVERICQSTLLSTNKNLFSISSICQDKQDCANQGCLSRT